MGLLRWIKRLGRRREADGVKYSLVLLRRRSFPINDESLHAAAERAFRITLPRNDPEAQDFAIADSPLSMVKVRGLLLGVYSVPMPYFDHPEEVVKSIADLRLRRAVEQHRAWISVDLLAKPDELQDQPVYQAVGRLLAEFTDDDCLALLCPVRRQGRAYMSELADQLRSDDPIRALDEEIQVPVLSVPDDDPSMQEAVDEARRRFPEFVRAFEAGDGSRHAVKAPITAGGNTEFIWIEVTEIGSSTIRGTLGNEPVELGGLREGDAVETTLDDLNDWVYMKGDDVVGAFTASVVLRAGPVRN